ncbi:MAG: metal ABC transporter permease [Thalassobaculaceae bacterium]
MFDDFVWRALAAGVGVALISGPIGCVVIWRRMAYFGDTLAHAALLGAALALLLDAPTILTVLAVLMLAALALTVLQRVSGLSADSLLGLLAHAALALGLVALALLPWVRVDLMGFLFGDILAVSMVDLAVIYIGGAAALLAFWRIWRPLFAASISPELAEAEGLRPARATVVFTLLLAAVIAIGMKIVGVLLVTAMVIIPAAAARRFARGPEQMALIAAIIGALSVVGGLMGSLEWDTPTGPSIVVAAALLFLVSLSPLIGGRRRGGAA